MSCVHATARHPADRCLADLRRLVLTRPSGPSVHRYDVSVRGCPCPVYTRRLGILPTVAWPTSVGWCLHGPPGLAFIGTMFP